MASLSRMKLSKFLNEICPNTYFQPPPTVRLKYPCFVYRKTKLETVNADNAPYILHTRYTVTYIDHNPDSGIPEMLAMTSGFTHEGQITKDNLYQDTFSVII